MFFICVVYCWCLIKLSMLLSADSVFACYYCTRTVCSNFVVALCLSSKTWMDTVKSYKGQTSTHCYFLPWTLFFCPPWPQQKQLYLSMKETHINPTVQQQQNGSSLPYSYVTNQPNTCDIILFLLCLIFGWLMMFFFFSDQSGKNLTIL